MFAKLLGKIITLLCGLGLVCQTGLSYASAQTMELPYDKIIISWQPIDGAVSYDLNLTDAQGKILASIKDIFPTGYEITNEDLPKDSAIKDPQEIYYTVQGLDYNKNPLGEPTTPQPLCQGLHFNRYWEEMQPAPTQFTPQDTANYLVEKDVLIPPLKLTGQFQQMGYMPVYPVFSWVKVKNADHYTIKVWRIIDKYQKEAVENITLGNTYDYYGDHSYHQPGTYVYKIIAQQGNTKLAESPLTYFTVLPEAKILALGDSITHGGGAISTPPSQTIYNWETYAAPYTILNAGYSGNTTANMLKRMDQDVLSFQPKYLIIMGGINDLRSGVPADTVIKNLDTIKNIAQAHGITPIILTVAPLNYQLTSQHVATPSPFWQTQLNQVNNWIKNQPYHLDITPELTDENQELKAQLTTDGLHPNKIGKEIIGKAVGNYLQQLLANEDGPELAPPQIDLSKTIEKR